MAGPGGREVGRISIKVTPDVSGFRDKLRSELAAIENSVRSALNVDVDLDTTKAKASMAALMTKLKAQGAKGVTIDTQIDQSQSAQVQKFAKSLGGLADSAGSAGSGLSSIGRTGAIAAAVLAAAAPAVALVAGLLAGLPSLITAFGAAGGAIALGLDGIKASAAQLIPSLDSLKASVSSVFEQRLTPIFDQLGKIFPTLETGMGAVANGLSDIAQGFVNVVTSGPGLAQIQNILAQTGTFFTSLSPVIATFTQSFLTLASSGASAFGQLLAPLQTFATGFNDVVNRLTSNGSFEAAMGGLSQVLGSVLGLFNRLFESGVQAMGQLGGPIANLVNGLGDAFIALMPALTSFSTLIGNVLGTALTALAPAITAITPAFTMLADTIGTLMTTSINTLAPVLTQVAQTLGGVLTTALATIQPLLPGLLASFANFSQVLTTQLAPVLPKLAESFGQMIAAIVPLIPQILQLATVIAVQVIPAIAKIAPIVAATVAAFATLVSKVAGAVTAFVEFVSGAVSNVASLPGKITAALSGIGTLLVGAGGDLIQGLINGIKSKVGAAISAVKDVAGSITGAIRGALGIRSPSTVFAEIGGYAMQGLDNGLADGKSSVIATIREIMQAIKDVFGSASGLALNFNIGGAGASGASLPAQLNQITSATKDFQSTVSSGISPKKLDDSTKAQIDQIKQQQKLLEIQAKQATIDSKGTDSKDEKKRLQDLAAQYRLQKDNLGLQADQLAYAEKYGGEIQGANAAFDGINQKIGQAGTGFLEANASQAMQDFGIGGGALTAALEQGSAYAKQTIFNVGSVDEALAVQRVQSNKDSLQFTQR